MRLLIQRVLQASVIVDQKEIAKINSGLLVLAGFEDADNDEDIIWCSGKITNLRIFDDANQIPNLSLLETKGDILLVSQFTLHAATKKGNRPSYLRASKGDIAIKIYTQLINQLEKDLSKKIQTGEFGAPMKVSLINDGPLTIWIDSKNKE